MPQWIKQGELYPIVVGPFISDQDGYTVQAGLTIGTTDVHLIKNGSSHTTRHYGGDLPGGTGGYYTCYLDATDLDTVGTLDVWINIVGSLPVWHRFMVVPALTYDALINGYDNLHVEVVGGAKNTEVIQVRLPGGVPVPGAYVLITTDQAATIPVFAAFTGSNGNATVFLDNGTYYVNITHPSGQWAQTTITSPTA